jgi:FAD-dependent urate hydroxylase
MTRGVVIVGAGPYGLSLAAHFAYGKVAHRIFGQPMQFWSKLADAAGERFLKSFCFGTSIPAPARGSTLPDYNAPRDLETFAPCSIRNFVDYGLWFARRNVSWVEQTDVIGVERRGRSFCVSLADGELAPASSVVVATGLSGYALIPREFLPLAPDLVAHTSAIQRFSDYEGADVAVIGSGQSALEAAALLSESGARPQMIVRGPSVAWNTRAPRRRNPWQRIRSPLSDLGSGPKAWALTRFPGCLSRAPAALRTKIVRQHLRAEGAWWLRKRVEERVPIQCDSRETKAVKAGDRALLKVFQGQSGREIEIVVDKVVLGTGYDIDVDRLEILDADVRGAIDRIGGAPKLDSNFESSVPGLYIIGPASAMSFGPLFRFVAGAAYSSKTVSGRLASVAAQ